MKTKHRPPTLRDVAAAAGVSTAAVSKYCSGAQRFSPAVEAAIQAAIEQLGYRTNHLARSIATGRSGTVGLVVLDLGNPHFTGIVKGASRVAQANDYSMAFVDTAESKAPERHLVETLSRRVDGLVVSSRLADESIEWLKALGKPVVFFGRYGHEGVHSVGADGYLASLMIGRHLMTLEHRRVAYLGFPGSRWNAERRRGLGDALAEAGQKLRVFEVDAPTPEAGEEAASRLLLDGQRPDAIVTYNDLIALGLMNEARSLGVSIPGDVSLASFDDIAYGRYTSPTLTSVAMNSEQMGEVAMQRLLQLIAGELEHPFDEVIAPRLVVRESTLRRSL
ncbi:MAG: LacI family DNA-binding transcriptional regulator [Paucibacter sp.]|nr:LacI family DNA-binding transcriptional regulator [Roseateles sp.]